VALRDVVRERDDRIHVLFSKSPQRRRHGLVPWATTPYRLPGPVHRDFLLIRQPDVLAAFSRSSLLQLRIAYHLPTCVSGRLGISLRNNMACSLRKNASEHAMGASVVVVAGWVSGAERHPTRGCRRTRGRRVQRRGAKSDGVGASTESTKRSGWEANSVGPVGRRDRCARMQDASCASNGA